jgi:hypothetical protein
MTLDFKGFFRNKNHQQRKINDLWRLESRRWVNEGKTKPVLSEAEGIVDANKEAFYFLGFALKVNISAKGKHYPHVNPKEKAVEKVKTQISEITAKNPSTQTAQG